MSSFPIVIAADAAFSIPSGLAVLSLIKSAKPSTEYHIYALDAGISKDVKEEIEKFKSTYNVYSRTILESSRG